MSQVSQGGLRARRLTPVGAAGVAVVEVRGAGTDQTLARWGVPERPPGSLHLAQLTGPEGPLDEALCWRRGPDHVELHLHGSGPLVQRVLALLRAADCATPVADFEQGWRAEAWQIMANAPCEVGARLALAQAEGALTRALAGLSGQPWKLAREAIQRILVDSERARPWLEATRVVLQGPVNAGKSTLFNALLGFERVITSSEEGTTRDAIMERIQLGSWPVDLVDTAGLRSVERASLEGRGQALGHQLAERADWVLFLVPHGFAGEIPQGATAIFTHGDRPGAPAQALRALDDPLGAVRRVVEAFSARFGWSHEPPYGLPLAITAEQRLLLTLAAQAESEPDWQATWSAIAAQL